MDTIKDIKLNKIYNDKLTNDNYQHLYSITLDKNKYYFIDLVSCNDCEFNLKIYDSNNDLVNTNLCQDEIDINEVSSDEYESNKNESQKKSYEDFLSSCEYSNDENLSEASNNNNLNDINEDNCMKMVLYENPEDPSDKIELIIEFNQPEYNKDQYYNAITKILNKQTITDYNNKIYFKPNESAKFVISVNSNYEGEEGEYTIKVNEVEDISNLSQKIFKVNQEKKIKLKKKMAWDKFIIELESNKNYNIDIEKKGIQMFIFGEGGIFNNEKSLNFDIQTKNGGKYMVDIMSLENNHENNIIINEILSEESCDESEESCDQFYEEILNENEELLGVYEDNSILLDDDNYFNSIIMKDSITDDKYILSIKEGKLMVDKI